MCRSILDCYLGTLVRIRKACETWDRREYEGDGTNEERARYCDTAKIDEQ
jgi:hypothetical protein